jgi:dihydrofolate reductase
MRKLIYAINLTLDGCCDHTKGIADDELLEFHTQLLADIDLLVFGRKTYQLMVPYWPDIAKSQSETKAANEFASKFDSINKVVFSHSLDRAEGNARIVRTTPRDEVARLKQQPGKNILTGGVDIPTQLIELDLVDVFCFVVQPVLAGKGRRLLDGASFANQRRLKLRDSKFLASGSVALRYSKQ